jgi:beta-phosphoglucomutase-like phosphatase (HAD superfamily)
LTLTGLKPFFGEHIFSSYVVQSWKPDPGLFLHAAGAMGFPPAACAVVEDSEVGVQAALNAGMRAFWFTDSGDPRLFPEVPRFADMRELPGLLGFGVQTDPSS